MIYVRENAGLPATQASATNLAHYKKYYTNAHIRFLHTHIHHIHTHFTTKELLQKSVREGDLLHFFSSALFPKHMYKCMCIKIDDAAI